MNLMTAGAAAWRRGGGLPPVFPVVQSITETLVPTDATAHNMALPAVVDAGNGLLAIMTFRRSAATAFTVTTPSGWTPLGELMPGPSQFSGKVALFWRSASGSEGGSSVDFVTSAATSAAMQCWRITGHGGTPAIATSNASAGGMNPDPPNLASGFSGNVLWLAGFGSNGSAAPTAWPTLFDNNQTTTASGGSLPCRVISCSRNAAVGTLNPGTFTMAATTNSGCFTIAVPPA